MIEEWKSVINNANYEVSNLGNVRFADSKILLKQFDRNGYKRVSFYRGERKIYSVHRLVAEAFIKNNDNFPIINHIDGNKSNNITSNLEWTTQKNNVQHAWNNNLCKQSLKRCTNAINQLNKINEKPEIQFLHKLGKPVKCLELNRIFLSIKRAGVKLGINDDSIQHSLKKGYRAGGFHWKYLEKHRFNNYGK